MEAQTRLGKRDRTEDSTDPFEESANALANVEGAMGAKPPPSTSKRTRSTKSLPTKKERSESIDQLISVAGSLLRDSTATAAAIAESNAAGSATAAAAAAISRNEPLVPNPIVLQQESTTLTYVNAADSALPPPALPPPQVASKPKSKQLSKSKAVDNKKTQVQYNPDVPMTKEQLTSWRREMRRVRNRESAAASRRKVRDRIEELEEEVDVWKMRYEEAMARLARAEEKKREGKREEI